jgi:hypothetical protein
MLSLREHQPGPLPLALPRRTTSGSELENDALLRLRIVVAEVEGDQRSAAPGGLRQSRRPFAIGVASARWPEARATGSFLAQEITLTRRAVVRRVEGVLEVFYAPSAVSQEAGKQSLQRIYGGRTEDRDVETFLTGSRGRVAR